jgi:hypothetical protein
MSGHFKEIVLGVLAALALGVLIAIWIFHHRGAKIIPHIDQKKSAQQLNESKSNQRAEGGLDCLTLSAG